MGLVLKILLPILAVSIALLCMPEIRKKDGMVKIGVLFGKEYDMIRHRFCVQSEFLCGLRGRGNWFVCIRVYEKANSETVIRTHLLSALGGQASAEKKAERVRALLCEHE
jgi:hypothetical protein